MNILHGVARFSVVGAYLVAYGLVASAQPPPVLYEDDFETGMQHWQTTDNDSKQSVWKIEDEGSAGVGNKALRVTGQSNYQPPHRSPHSIAWLKDLEVGSFQLDVRAKNTKHDAGPHRDLCLFWGRQDSSHFYYAHLGAQADPHACQIFIVNGAARKAITTVEAEGTPWTNDWHHVRVIFDAESGAMRVYFDDLETPLLAASDKTFVQGQVGVGTFDDHGNFDDFVLRGVRIR